MTRSDLDCRSCGACCGGSHANDEHAHCTADDVIRMSRAARARLVDRGGRIGMVQPGDTASTATDDDGRCVFLRGTIGARSSCRIYETRPDVCRDFRPGSLRCRDARRAMGLA